MNLLDQLHAFQRVAELASFTQAAEQLGWPKGRVSIQIQALEARLGTRLFHRTTRRVQLTQDGLVFHERCRDVLADVDELQSLFQRDEQALRGRVRLDMSTGVARQVVMPALPAFLQRHPLLELELSSTDRRVDVVREGFDCVIRVGSVVDGGLVARPLGRYRMVNCASPAYLAQFGQPRSLEDLATHRLVHYVPTLGARPDGFEHLGADGTTQFLPMAGSMTVNNADAYVAACRAGLGIVQAPEMGVREALASGELVELLPQHRPASMPVTLLYAHRRQLPRRVRTVMDWLAGLLQPHLEPWG